MQADSNPTLNSFPLSPGSWSCPASKLPFRCGPWTVCGGGAVKVTTCNASFLLEKVRRYTRCLAFGFWSTVYFFLSVTNQVMIKQINCEIPILFFFNSHSACWRNSSELLLVTLTLLWNAHCTQLFVILCLAFVLFIVSALLLSIPLQHFCGIPVFLSSPLNGRSEGEVQDFM